MSDSSDTDNDHLSALKEAQVDFATNLYSRNYEKREDSKPINPQPPSLRFSDDQTEYDKAASLSFTPGIQKYIAKHLTTFLDQQLKEVKPTKQKQKIFSNDKDDGIHLFKSSQLFVNSEANDDISIVHNSRCKQFKSDENSDEDMMKVKESAVHVDWILSGEALKGWEKSTKGEVIPGIVKDSVTSKKKKKRKKIKDEKL